MSFSPPFCIRSKNLSCYLRSSRACRVTSKDEIPETDGRCFFRRGELFMFCTISSGSCNVLTILCFIKVIPFRTFYILIQFFFPFCDYEKVCDYERILSCVISVGISNLSKFNKMFDVSG